MRKKNTSGSAAGLSPRLTKGIGIVQIVLLVLFLAHCGFFTDLAVDPAKTPSAVSGRVVDSLSGAGLAGVTVLLKGESAHETVTGPDGAFSFTGIFTGGKKLEFSLPYYRTCAMDLELTGEGEEGLDIRLVRQNAAPSDLRTVYPGQTTTDIPLTMRFKWVISDPDFAHPGSREALFYVFTMDTGAVLKDSGALPAPASGTSLSFRAPLKRITGLKPGALYRWKLVVRDCLGAVSALEDSFTTRPDIGPEVNICSQGMVLVETEGLPAFCMDKYEMTNASFEASNADSNRNSENRPFFSNKSNMPATKVAPPVAGRSCKILGKRLCRADEWMAVVVGWEDWDYPYGEDYDNEKCNTEKLAFQSISDQGGADTTGQNPGCVSPFGIYDLSGNVAEWVTYSNIYPFPQDSLLNYTFYYIGGSWSSKDDSGIKSKKSIKTSSQNYNQEDIGFRCCKDPQ